MILKFFKTEYLEKELVKRFIGDVDAEFMSKEEIEKVLQDLSEVENYEKLLKSTIKGDRIRFFNVPKESQDIVRGAFHRTLSWLTAIRKQNQKNINPKVKLDSPRHAQ